MSMEQQREASNIIEWIFIAVGLGMFFYHMICTQYLFFGNFEHQTVHLAFLLFLTFLQRMRKQGGRLVYTLHSVLILLSLLAAAYVFFNIEHIEEVVGYPDPPDILIGVIIMVLVIEGTRQAWGLTLPIVGALFIAYFFFGHLIPGPLHHRAFNLDYIVSYLCIGFTGVYGTFLSISANQIFLFVVFGALMEVIRITDFLYEMGKLVGRVLEGGPAQTAVVSSSLVGMVTGAAVANVAITGAFTIPYMKKIGYTPELAGAIEATASTGGQLMPPVMGAAAFLMAFFLGVPFAEIMLAGILPAVFFYFAVFIGVQLVSVANHICVPKEKADVMLILRRLPLFAIPLAVIIVLLLLRFSPMLAAFWAIIVAIALSFVDRQTRPSLLELARSLANGAATGAKIGVSLCVVGMIAQTLVTTGLGSKIAGLVEALSGGNLALALLITMVVSIILGCGVPPVAAYSLVAITTVPALLRMGVLAISAHFFCFYFSIISAVTPPVAMGALAAAGIAKSNYFRTSLIAFKLSISGFIIPYLIVYNPILNLQVVSVPWAVGSLIAVPLALVTLTAFIYNVGLVGLIPLERGIALLCAIMMFGYCVFRHIRSFPLEYPMFLMGLVSFGVLLLMQLKRVRTRDSSSDIGSDRTERG